MFLHIINFVKRKKQMFNYFTTYSQYMSPGKYVFDDSLMFIYRKDIENYKKSMEIFEDTLNFLNPLKKLFLKFVKQFIFNKKIMIEKTAKEFNGTLFFIGIDKNSAIKIFDFTSNKVMTIYFSEKDFHEIIQNYNYFKKFLNPPKIVLFDTKKRIVVEELVNYKPYNNWTEEDSLLVIDDIFERYLSYFKFSKNEGNYYFHKPITLLTDIEEDDKGKEFFFSVIDSHLLYMELPFLKMHGDLWAPNILLSDKQVIYIDFEYADNYLFLYDVFWFIHDQVMNHNNYFFLVKYLTGAFDSYFRKIFSVFELTFEEKNRVQYLHLYFLNVYVKRWRPLHSYKRKIQLNNYKKMLEKLNKLGLMETSEKYLDKKQISYPI